MNQKVDQLVMLLSTDWFGDYWSLLGLRADASTREKIKIKFRVVVDQIFSGESNYWMISFSEERISRTFDLFQRALVESKLDQADIDTLKRISSQIQLEDGQADSVSLLESLTQLLALDASPDILKDISPELATKIASVFSASNANGIDFVRLSLNSNTDWDKKIRSYTDDLQEYLGDFASSLYDQTNHFVRFWAQLTQHVSLEERKQLIVWYDDTANELIGRGPTFPHWMC